MEVGSWLPRREHHQHRLRVQTSRRERQRLRRGPVQPLRVVDHTQKRPLGGHLRQQAQHGQADQEPIRRRARFQAERGAQGGPLRLRQPVQTIQHRPAQLMQRGEGQFHLRLDPDRPGHPQVRRLLDHVIQQGGLPHACFAPHDQHRAAPGTHLLEQPVQDPALDPSPEQPAGRLAGRSEPVKPAPLAYPRPAEIVTRRGKAHRVHAASRSPAAGPWLPSWTRAALNPA